MEVVPSIESAPNYETKKRRHQREKQCDCHQRGPLLERNAHGREEPVMTVCPGGWLTLGVGRKEGLLCLMVLLPMS